MHREDAALLAALAHRRRWVWIAGNHDSALPSSLPGEAAGELTIGSLVLRHQADGEAAAGEISGHFHPKVSVRARGRVLVRRAFLEDGRRLVMPAFGAYAGGLDAGDPALRALFPHGFLAHVLGRTRVFTLRPAAPAL
jgi:hypothetical protein